MIAFLIQFALVFFSGLAFALLNLGGKWTRWGAVVGLIAQPFWFAALQHGQWGMFLLTLWLTACYIAGIARGWFPTLIVLPTIF